MTRSFQGTPCWYELATRKESLAAAGDFYARILGWTIEDADMQDFTYHLARAEGDPVAGLMEMPPGAAEMPPFWMTYFAVDDADGFVARASAAGARIHRAPADIPGTGRFALLADPQGAGFGILQPDMSAMSEADAAKAASGAGAYNPRKPGHGHWHELMSTDPVAGYDFYSGLFGWAKGEAMDMGEAGTYQLFRHDGADIGGMMGLGDAPGPIWLPYFGVAGRITDSMDAIRAAGGHVHHGPQEVPGGAFVAIAKDPPGAWFALVAPRE